MSGRACVGQARPPSRRVLDRPEAPCLGGNQSRARCPPTRGLARGSSVQRHSGRRRGDQTRAERRDQGERERSPFLQWDTALRPAWPNRSSSPARTRPTTATLRRVALLARPVTHTGTPGPTITSSPRAGSMHAPERRPTSPRKGHRSRVDGVSVPKVAASVERSPSARNNGRRYTSTVVEVTITPRPPGSWCKAW